MGLIGVFIEKPKTQSAEFENGFFPIGMRCTHTSSRGIVDCIATGVWNYYGSSTP
jgi:hypothetical protein